VCARYSVGKTPEELAAELDAHLATEETRARYNVAPSQPAPMLVAMPERRLGVARFGWRREGDRGLLLNARAETVVALPTFRAAIERRRSLVPADGFYEWKARAGSRRSPREAFFFHRQGALMTFAGLFVVERSVSEPRAAFVILTTAPSPVVAQVHDRMPLIVPEELRDAWMDPRVPAGALLPELLRRDPALEVRAISPRIGAPSLDEPSLRDPLGAR
jgi:putative SOS response-associated peptidase YedK